MKKVCIGLAIAFLAIVLVGILFATLSKIQVGDKIALLTIEGPITSSYDITQDLREYADNPSVKAIVLRVDSPGGAVAPSQEIYEEVKKATLKKKVVVSMGSLAASGGYYISAPATRILANPGSITGSIGVIMELPNFKGLMEKIGVKTEVIKAGAHKDLASVFRELGPEERAILQGVMDNVHEQFIKAVAEGRKLPVEKVREIADGRIFSGEQAITAGLVDQIGDLNDAFDIAKRLAGIKGEPSIIKKKKKGGVLDLLKGKISINLPEATPSISFKYIYSP